MVGSPPSSFRPTLAQLDVLRSVLLTRSFGGAAKLLGVSQPAVSKGIRQIERNLGLPLLAKDGSRFLPTAEAEALVPEIEKLFGTLDAILRMATTLRGETGAVCVAAIPTQILHFLVPAAHQFRQAKPWIKVELLVLANKPVIDAVLSGKADFGVVHSITPAPELRVEDIGRQRMVCIAPLAHRFGSLDCVRASDLLAETFVSYGQDTSMGRWLKATFRREGLSVPVQIEIGASNALIEAVRIGAGIGLVEEGALDERDKERLIIRPFEPALELQARIISRPGRPLTKEATEFLSAFRDVTEVRRRRDRLLRDA